MKYKKLIVPVLFIVALAVGVPYAGEAERGQKVFNDVNLGTNGKSCNSCHADGRDIDGSKNTFTILGSAQNSIEDAVNFCIKMALNGTPLEKDSDKMQDMVSYLKSLKDKKPPKRETPGY